jgi:hypothetical protein
LYRSDLLVPAIHLYQMVLEIHLNPPALVIHLRRLAPSLRFLHLPH